MLPDDDKHGTRVPRASVHCVTSFARKFLCQKNALWNIMTVKMSVKSMDVGFSRSIVDRTGKSIYKVRCLLHWEQHAIPSNMELIQWKQSNILWLTDPLGKWSHTGSSLFIFAIGRWGCKSPCFHDHALPPFLPLWPFFPISFLSRDRSHGRKRLTNVGRTGHLAHMITEILLCWGCSLISIHIKYKYLHILCPFGKLCPYNYPQTSLAPIF